MLAPRCHLLFIGIRLQDAPDSRFDSRKVIRIIFQAASRSTFGCNGSTRLNILSMSDQGISACWVLKCAETRLAARPILTRFSSDASATLASRRNSSNVTPAVYRPIFSMAVTIWPNRKAASLSGTQILRHTTRRKPDNSSRRNRGHSDCTESAAQISIRRTRRLGSAQTIATRRPRVLRSRCPVRLPPSRGDT